MVNILRRTIRQKLSGFLEEINDHLIFLGHWDSKGQPRFVSSENGKQVNFNVRRYLWEEATGNKLNGKRLKKRCNEEHCVSPEHCELRINNRKEEK